MHQKVKPGLSSEVTIFDAFKRGVLNYIVFVKTNILQICAQKSHHIRRQDQIKTTVPKGMF